MRYRLYALSQGRSVVDTSIGNFPQRDCSLTFGGYRHSDFNKNQGEKRREISIKQAQQRGANLPKESSEARFYLPFNALKRQAGRFWHWNSRQFRARRKMSEFSPHREIGEIKITDLIAEQRRLLDAKPAI